MSYVSNAIRILPEPVRTIAFGSISGTYMGVGTPLANPSRILYILNATNALLMFSYDGVNDHQALPASSFLLLDLTANKTNNAGSYISQNTRIYVKTIGSPTSGSVYISTYYGSLD